MLLFAYIWGPILQTSGLRNESAKALCHICMFAEKHFAKKVNLHPKNSKRCFGFSETLKTLATRSASEDLNSCKFESISTN